MARDGSVGSEPSTGVPQPLDPLAVPGHGPAEYGARVPLARRIAAKVLPDSAKRAHERWTNRRRTRALREPTRAYVERYGTTVRHGPLAGLRYPEAAIDSGTDYLVAKLAGTYELELHDVLRGWVGGGFEHVVDVGCAEGYYAVGLARAMPQATVHAFDIDDRARARCTALAELNGVADRVRVQGDGASAALARLPAQGVALLCDAEGYERTLLDPEVSPRLAGWPIIVELHDFIDPSISELIVTRFSSTHAVRLIDERSRDGVSTPELADVPARRRGILLDECRPSLMRWAYLEPAARSSTASVSAA